MYIYRSVYTAILSTIQPVENIGDVLHDENVLKSYMYSVTY